VSKKSVLPAEFQESDKCLLGAGCVNGARPDLRGGELNCTWIKYCDTTRGNGWQTGNTNRILNTREFALLTSKPDLRVFFEVEIIVPAR